MNILVTDSNDNEPKFEQLEYGLSYFDHNRTTDICLGSVKANDPDLGLNGTIEYYMVNSSSNCNHSSPFIINKTTGQICVKDKVVCSKYMFAVQAKDNGLQPLISKINANVLITKRSFSDNKPLFFQQDSNAIFNFNRYSLAGSYIAWVKAFTLDYGVNSKIDYKVVAKNDEQLSSQFSVDSDGYLRNMLELVNLRVDEIKLNIIASNRELPHLFTDKNVTIRLTNETIDNKNKLIPSQVILYLTSNQLDYLSTNRNMSIFKFNYENSNEPRVKYAINYLDNECTISFEINESGELFIKNFTNLIFNDVCILNISIGVSTSVELIVLLTNSQNSSLILASSLLRRNKHENGKNILTVDFNQMLIILIIFLFSLLLTILICLIILMRCRNKQKNKFNGDNDLFVHTGKESATSKSTSPSSSSSSSIENTSSSTNSKLTEIESLESLKINNTTTTSTNKNPTITTSTTIWLGSPTIESSTNKQINEVCLQLNLNPEINYTHKTKGVIKIPFFFSFRII